MPQQQKQPFWYKLLHPSNNPDASLSSTQNLNDLLEVKVLTENDLKIEQILIEEFRYRGESIKQVLSDMSNTFYLYFIFLGISFSGLGVIYQLAGGLGRYLQTVEVLVLLALGIVSTLFCVRFATLTRENRRHKACMDLIRGYYIKHLHIQIPDISNVFSLSFDHNAYPYRPILFFTFTIIDSLCFTGAAFGLGELWLHIKIETPFTLPSDPRLYIVGLLTGTIIFLFHILYFRTTTYPYLKKLREAVAKERAI